MKEKRVLLTYIICFIAIVIFLCLMPLSQESDYEYIDNYNQKGTAIQCWFDKEPVCELEDKTIIAVKEYKKGN